LFYDIVIVDTGCNQADVGRTVYGKGILASTDNNAQGRRLMDDYSDSIGHGTAISYIISSKLPDARIFMLKIFGEKERIDSGDLAFALEYIYNNLSCKVINISLGIRSCANKDAMYAICQKFLSRGTIIVAAFDNAGAISFPAAFDNVIGVDYSMKCVGFNDFEFVTGSIINIRGTLREQLVPWTNGTRKSVQGNSFIAPHITCKVYEAVSSGRKSLKEVLRYLKDSAIAVLPFKYPKPLPTIFEIESAVAFPFNKEIHALARYKDLSIINRIEFYDDRHSGQVNRKLAHYGIESEEVINDFEQLSWGSGFDTFILGHNEQLSTMVGTDYSEQVLERCLKYRKNLITFDSLPNNEEATMRFSKKGLSLYCPNVSVESSPDNTDGKLFSFHVPILLVLGTSQKQGKFSLQLELRRMFRTSGYKVGQLGTEPTSLLFGFDRCYPIGYNSNDQLSSQQRILLINRMLFEIAETSPDLIIVGSQSNVLPSGGGNVRNFPQYQQDILAATQPDGCLLMVNASDEVEYICNTINYIEVLSRVKVVALVIAPVNKTQRWTVLGNEYLQNSNGVNGIAEFIQSVSAKTNKPTFEFNRVALSRLFDEIVHYFSEA
jgi:uncharacterized NAD-dependent epimerase/dehydratase family protein